MSAVEFAMLAPLMVALYLGTVEIADGVAASRKVSLVAATIANLTAQVTTISTTEMSNILDASTAIISPYDASKLKMTVTCISINASKVASIKWSVTRNGTVKSGTPSLPSGLLVANTQLILSETSYAYTPIVGYKITGTLTLSDKMYMSPRIAAPTYGTTACS